MSPEIEALSKRAVACPAWMPWRGPMVVHRHVGDEVRFGVKHGHDGELLRVWYEGRTEWWPRGECLPDLDDDGTLGCLEGMVRDSFRVAYLSVGHCSNVDGLGAKGVGIWLERVAGADLPEGHHVRLVGAGLTKAHALVAALEAAAADVR